ncbi:hypothetical protein AB1046_07885 [Promicromonospora sp. Populi]|uniref:hypothetical protein n=1 Tax=Promicromonospora sp. Populi TaxID=3239420 RepID=UPI0034E2EF08
MTMTHRAGPRDEARDPARDEARDGARDKAGLPSLASSDTSLGEIFDWACRESLGFVRTGRAGEVPSYWAGLQDRPMFYSRDVCHQALAGHLLGLGAENFVMLEHFARSATERRGFYPLWAFLFDGTPAPIDYHDDDRFVRETPAAFELAETALRLYRWTGDERYRTGAAFASYYRNLVREFIPRHDILGTGVAGERGTEDIFAGSPSYNESREGAGLQVAGDGLSSQWAALTAIARLVPDAALAAEAQQAADITRRVFEDSWWDADAQQYLTGVSADRRFTDFAYEPSWFPAVKGLLPAGERATAHLDFVARGMATRPPANIEAFTYLPEAYLAYDDDATAMSWIRHLADSRSDYPEVPFTLVQHLALGLTGLEPAWDGALQTRSHVHDQWIQVDDVPVGPARVSIRHEGQEASTLTVVAGQPVRWSALVGGRTEHHVVRAGESVRVTA